MQIEIIGDLQELLKIKKEWGVLYEKLKDMLSPFSSYDWYEIWWKHYSAGEALNVIVLWDADRLVGIAPLMLRRANMHGLPVRAVCFIDNNQTFLNDFLVLPEYREVFLRRVLGTLFDSGHTCKWDLIFLNKLTVLSENYRCLRNILEERGCVWKEDQTIDARHLIPEGKWSDFLSARSTRTRKTLRNIQNTIKKAGHSSVRHIRTREEFQDVWEGVCRVAQGSWTEKHGDSIASPQNRDFFKDLASRAAENGWLSLWTLILNEEIIAMEFHLRANRRAYAMRGHYLAEYARYSPGTYLEMQVLKHLFEEEDRLLKYDMGNFYSYKRKWSDNSEPHMALSIFNKRPYSRLVSFHELQTVPTLRRMLPKSFWEHKFFKIIGIKTAPFTIRQN